ncbi:hypothetical protein HD806DRAFT_145599 [Xylariaceae sp. AK1471]|nr:hypothetical protein HD806DRAFT_145599 [Xylariaceae sp. AK1471]
MADTKPDVKLGAQSGTETDEQKQSRIEWAKEKYNEQYEAWMPWIEDTFLKYFTKDNKASYATRDQLDKTKVTGVKQVDNLQDGVNNLAAGQLGQGGMLQPVGDLVSKEGVDRADPRRKDKEGLSLPSVSGLGKGLGL